MVKSKPPERVGRKTRGPAPAHRHRKGSQLPMSITRITRITRIDEGISRDSGIALVEILVSLTLLAVGMLSLIATLAQNSRLQRVTHEKHLAIAGAESVLEDMRRADFGELITTYGTAGSPGNNFDLIGLNARTSDADGHVGLVSFILDETATDTVAARFGLPRDLDGDGNATAINVSAGYRLLPVRIQIEWEGVGGASYLEFHAVLTRPEESE